MLQSSSVFQCEGSGGAGGVAVGTTPVIPMTSICGRRPAKLAIPPSARPTTTSKM